MKIFAIIPLSPSVLVPSKSGRNVNSIASNEVQPSTNRLKTIKSAGILPQRRWRF